MTNLNLHLTRIFYYVASNQSFSRAAEKLFISQSAVSKAIKELESQLALPLIERTTKGSKGIKLTENGQVLFEHAQAIFSLEKAAITDLQARLELKKGHLVIGASTTIASYWLPAYIANFYQQYPDIELEIMVGNTEMMHQLLINYEIDIAVVEGSIEDERITLQKWQEEELKIITAPHHSFSTKELDQQLWVVREPGSGTYAVTEETLKTLSIKPKQRLTLASNEGIARTVASGAGVAILPACTVKELVSLNKLKTVQHPKIATLTRPLYLASIKKRNFSPLVQAFTKLLNQKNNH